MGTKKRVGVVHYQGTPSENPQMRNLEELLSIPEEINEELVEAEIERDPVINRLSYRQKLFAIHYCKAFNGTAAAIAAGYAEKAAHVQAHRLLKHPGVQQLVLRRTSALAAATGISREWVLTELSEMLEDIRMSPTPDRALQIKALDMIAKLQGYYVPELAVNIQNNIESIRIEIVKPGNESSD